MGYLWTMEGIHRQGAFPVNRKGPLALHAPEPVNRKKSGPPNLKTGKDYSWSEM